VTAPTEPTSGLGIVFHGGLYREPAYEGMVLNRVVTLRVPAFTMQASGAGTLGVSPAGA
jgi:hypothetical protein